MNWQGSSDKSFFIARVHSSLERRVKGVEQVFHIMYLSVLKAIRLAQYLPTSGLAGDCSFEKNPSVH